MSERPEPRWGIPDAIGGLVGANVLSALAVGLWVGASGDRDTTFGVAMAGLVGLWAGFVGIPWLVARRKGSGSLVDEYGLRVEGGDLAPGLVAGLGSQLFLLPVLYLGLRALFPDTFADPGRDAKDTFDLAHGAGRAVMALALVVGAPLVEELLFRGLFQRALVRRLGPSAGIVITAAVFAAVHGSVAALPGLFLFGVVLGVLAHRAARLGPGIVAHVAFNAATVTVFLLTR